MHIFLVQDEVCCGNKQVILSNENHLFLRDEYGKYNSIADEDVLIVGKAYTKN